LWGRLNSDVAELYRDLRWAVEPVYLLVFFDLFCALRAGRIDMCRNMFNRYGVLYRVGEFVLDVELFL
jgi:hypothetical protein